MQLNPTRRSTHLSWAGAITVGVGIVFSLPMAVACGCALLCGVALARALTLVSVSRARAAGFEMLWATRQRMARVTRQHELVLTAELRNRDSLPTHFKDLQVTCSPYLEVTVTPRSGVVPARGRLYVEARLRARKVGYHGVHGLMLQTVRAPGLYTVPLSFSNPFVLEVLPRPVRLGQQGARGGRSRLSAPEGRAGPLAGDGAELKEIREHQPGDPFKRIAWKASARRGRLLVVEKEREERDAVWLLLDASVDSASGPPGLAPLDRAIDDVTHLAETHLGRGDLVGLVIVGSRELARVPLGRGPRHAAHLISALTLATHTADADRSDWDERDVTRRALEHMRSLDARATELSHHDRASVAELAHRMLPKAPVRAEAPWAITGEERCLRQYLLSFGIQPPPRGTSDRHATELRLADLLAELSRQRPRPSLIYLASAPPSFETPPALLDTLARMPRRRTEVRFLPQMETLVSTTNQSESQARLATDALSLRLELAARKGIEQLARCGVRTVQPSGRRQESGRSKRALSMTTLPSTTTRTL